MSDDPPTLRLDRYWSYIAPAYFGAILVFGLYTLFTMGATKTADDRSVLRLTQEAIKRRATHGNTSSNIRR